MTLRRRSFALGVLSGAAVTLARPSLVRAAGRVTVPEGLQAKLIAKVAAFDRNMAARAGGTVRILVLQRNSDPESVRGSTRLRRSLGQLSSIASMPVSVSSSEYQGATDLAQKVRNQGISIVYLTPGLEGGLYEIASALQGQSVISASSVPDHVTDGSVLSFDLEEGRPRILVHLGRARAQRVDFKASFLKLARIVDR